jgi:hypothetical protein
MVIQTFSGVPTLRLDGWGYGPDGGQRPGPGGAVRGDDAGAGAAVAWDAAANGRVGGWLTHGTAGLARAGVAGDRAGWADREQAARADRGGRAGAGRGLAGVAVEATVMVKLL